MLKNELFIEQNYLLFVRWKDILQLRNRSREKTRPVLTRWDFFTCLKIPQKQYACTEFEIQPALYWIWNTVRAAYFRVKIVVSIFQNNPEIIKLIFKIQSMKNQRSNMFKPFREFFSKKQAIVLTLLSV
jgi:hypothetical protein